MSFIRCKRELYDRPNVNTLHVNEGSDGEFRGTIVATLLYGCATSTPYKANYNNWAPYTPQRVASNPREPGAGRRTNRILFTKQTRPLQGTEECGKHRDNHAHEEVPVGGGTSKHGHGRSQRTQANNIKKTGGRGTAWAGGGEEEMEDWNQDIRMFEIRVD